MGFGFFIMRRFILAFNILFGFIFICFADEPFTLGRIIVSKSDSFEITPLNKNYSLQTITNSEIKQKNINSVLDVLDYISGVDLRYRGTFGIQGDLSLRGSTYEQVAVLIDGIKVIDPQTGHYNLDIPLTVFDVEKIDIVKEGISSLYGAGAFAGSINIITKKPQKKQLNLNTLFGEHALFGQEFSGGFIQQDLSGRVSFDHKVSSGAQPNTDFEYKTATLYLDKDFESANFNALFGYQKKDFGADSFYSNLFPEEEEHTETVFVKNSLESKLDFGSLKNNLFFRKHTDKFILRRNNPASINYHTTYVYGVNSQISLPLKYGEIILGLDTGRDEIYSTNLGKHTRLHEAGSFGFIPELWDKLTADMRLRIDNYQKWGIQQSYNFGLGYDMVKDRLKIKGSVSRAFRIPSYTELYYSDAANRGEPDLKIEQNHNFRLGLDFKDEFFNFGFDTFLRRGRNLIDWTRRQTTDLWQATSLGKVDFYGVEFRTQMKLGANFKWVNLEKINFSYNYTAAEKKANGFFSKYALDILKNQYILDIYSQVLGLSLDWQLLYNQRYYGETYFVGNIYLSKKFINKNFTVEPFVKIDNFSNTKYSEISGVSQPGRWIKSGLKFEW
jgi:iron complex outermembrane receptor protein